MIEKEQINKLIAEQKQAVSGIKGTASEINMISINAAIESAHAASGIRTVMENVLDGTMTTICRMLTKVLETGGLALDVDSVIEFAKFVGVDDIFITDADGVTVASNTPEAIGWRFPDDPKAQAYAFRALITQKDGVVTQPIKARDLDSVMYKYVGVSRTDQPGIVQIGYRAESITRYQTEIGTVFGILATEIKNLGTRVLGVSKRIMDVTAEFENKLKEQDS